MSDKKYITFIDNAGRAIFGVNSEETSDTVKVENPVMIIVNQQQNGQMAVQLFPIFFQEFTVEGGENGRNNYFTYSKASIAQGTDFEIEPRIVEQYKKIVNPTLVPAGAPGGETADPEVIKLFDE